MSEKYRVMIVDDSDENLDILKNALKDDYRISIVKDGASALNVINTLMPDLILLDIRMPGIDGYETLKRIKKMKRFTETPVIFISGESDIQNKSWGFQLGAVDFITKPYDILEVKLRVRTHMELSKSREERKDLLSNTLVGTIQALLEILSMTNNFAYTFSSRTKRLASGIARDMGIEEVWKVEIAAMLSLIGACMMSSEVLEKILSGKTVSIEERKLFASHPMMGSKLIAKIPRLEDLAEIVKNQMEPLGNMEFDGSNTVLSGAQILSVVINYQMYNLSGHDKSRSINLLKQNPAKCNFDVTKALEKLLRYEEAGEIRTISLKELKSGMLVGEDIKSQDDHIIIKKGSVVNDLIIEHLRLLNELGKMEGTLRIQTVN